MIFSHDDFVFMNACINSRSINEFYESVIKLHEEYKNISHGEFLRRSFVFSGKYLTFAGALMFSNIIRIRAELKYSNGRVRIESYNIWDAYKNILPRLSAKISGKSSVVLREIFVNALLHSDYNLDNKINVTITPKPAKILIENPGIIANEIRNQRLEKIFRLSGISESKHEGLEKVKKYIPEFRLEEDKLNLRTRALFEIEGFEDLPSPVIL